MFSQIFHITRKGKFILDLADLSKRTGFLQTNNVQEARTIMKFPNFLWIIVLFMIFNSESPRNKVSQALFCKLNLAMFRAHGFDCHIKPQLMSEDAF